MTNNEHLQRIWRWYEEAGMPTPASAKDVAAWAVERKLWQPHDSSLIAQCAEDLSRAWREEYRRDFYGRRYRAKHAVRVKSGEEQMTIWADIETAPRDHMEKAFAQRRKQIVGDCHQLKTDVDCYNDSRSAEQPIQLILDFTRDVRELELMESSSDLIETFSSEPQPQIEQSQTAVLA